MNILYQCVSVENQKTLIFKQTRKSIALTAHECSLNFSPVFFSFFELSVLGVLDNDGGPMNTVHFVGISSLRDHASIILCIRCRHRHHHRHLHRPRRDRLACPRIRTRTENLFSHCVGSARLAAQNWHVI